MSIQENPLRAEKRRKLHALREKGINPYPYSYEGRAPIAKIVNEHAAGLNAGEKKHEAVYRVSGRLMTLRAMGKASFFNVQDQTGSLQIYIKNEELAEQDRAAFELIDLGDIVGVEGFVFKSQKGEFS